MQYYDERIHKEQRLIELKKQLENLSLDLICALGEHNQFSTKVSNIRDNINDVYNELEQLETELY